MFPASLQDWIEVPALVSSTEKIAGLSISLNQTGFIERFLSEQIPFAHGILVDLRKCC